LIVSSAVLMCFLRRSVYRFFLIDIGGGGGRLKTSCTKPRGRLGRTNCHYVSAGRERSRQSVFRQRSWKNGSERTASNSGAPSVLWQCPPPSAHADAGFQRRRPH